MSWRSVPTTTVIKTAGHLNTLSSNRRYVVPTKCLSTYSFRSANHILAISDNMFLNIKIFYHPSQNPSHHNHTQVHDCNSFCLSQNQRKMSKCETILFSIKWVKILNLLRMQERNLVLVSLVTGGKCERESLKAKFTLLGRGLKSLTCIVIFFEIVQVVRGRQGFIISMYDNERAYIRKTWLNLHCNRTKLSAVETKIVTWGL